MLPLPLPEWVLVQRPVGPAWLHNTLPVWIVEFPATAAQAAWFQAYLATEERRSPLHPGHGGVNNRALGKLGVGFPTLREACGAALHATMDMQPRAFNVAQSRTRRIPKDWGLS